MEIKRTTRQALRIRRAIFRGPGELRDGVDIRHIWGAFLEQVKAFMTGTDLTLFSIYAQNSFMIPNS